jgi:Flp pilus assembly CpaE family ATPase
MKRLWPILREWFPEGDKARLLVNRHYKGATLGLKDLEQVVHRPVFQTLSSDYAAVIAAINQGKPLAETGPRSRFYQDLQNLAQRLVLENGGQKAAPAPAGPRLFRFFSRK